MGERDLRIQPRRLHSDRFRSQETDIARSCENTAHDAATPDTVLQRGARARPASVVDTPGVTLTTADAALIAGLDRQVCRVLLRTLIETGFLEQRVGGCSSAARRIPTNPGRGGLKWSRKCQNAVSRFEDRQDGCRDPRPSGRHQPPRVMSTEMTSTIGSSPKLSCSKATTQPSPRPLPEIQRRLG